MGSPKESGIPEFRPIAAMLIPITVMIDDGALIAIRMPTSPEIREALRMLSAPASNSLVHFKLLCRNEIRQVINWLVDGLFSKLAPNGAARLKSDDMNATLDPLANKSSEVRKLGKLVDEVISLVLVRAMLGTFLQASENSDTEDVA